MFLNAIPSTSNNFVSTKTMIIFLVKLIRKQQCLIFSLSNLGIQKALLSNEHCIHNYTAPGTDDQKSDKLQGELEILKKYTREIK